MKRALTLVLPILFTVFALAACSSNNSSSPQESDGAEIVAHDYTFTVSGPFTPGQTVTLRNDDTVEHSVTSDSPTSDNGDLFDIEIKPGATATLTAPDEPGSYGFHCRYHPFMLSSFTVQ
ncbi:cupredoxin domain-containing protein [Rhodococcus sp. NPDC049939]|uniref:cupredoxin domain-containing protein n=1 Tax=Rhodococcus sp. NPDC049939 TaxID=3155511 RepID=UPI0033CF057D